MCFSLAINLGLRNGRWRLSLLSPALFFKSLCLLCGGSLFSEYSLSPCPGYLPFVPSNLFCPLSNLAHSLWRSKTEGGRNQAVYFLSLLPSDLQSSLSLSRRLWLLSSSSFHRVTQRRDCVSVSTPSSALPRLGALMTACCCQPQAPELSLLILLNQASQSLEPQFCSSVRAACWTSAVHQKYNLSYEHILKFSGKHIIKPYESPSFTPMSLLRRPHS